MNLFQIIFKQMRQRALSTWLTLLSVVLGSSLAIGILVLQREGDQLFGQTDFGYDLLIGPPKGSPLQLTLNTVYHLDQSAGVLPHALYADLARKTPPTGNQVDYRAYVRWAVPFMVGDSFSGRRIIGTSPQMFGLNDDGSPVTGEAFQYRLNKSYAFAQGRTFAARKFEAVIGADTAKSLHLKLYDPSRSEKENLAVGGAFRATHGMPKEGETPDVHDPVWKIVGILQPTGTANDRVLFVPYISLYAIAEHEEGMAEQALLRARFDPRKIPPERIPEALRQIGIDPDRLPESVKKKYRITTAPATTRPAEHIGDLMQDAAVKDVPKDEHDLHDEHDEHDGHDHDHDHPESYTLDAEGNITPTLPEEEWQLSAVFVKSRGGFQAQQLSYNFRVIETRAIAINPAIAMGEFFRTFMGPSTVVLLVIATLVSVVAAASIMTTIYNSVSARLREIAILRALGATRTRILTLISLEAALIGILGSLAGLLVGHLLCAIGSSFAERTIGESINWTKISALELYYLVGVVVLAFIAGLVPALKAYRTSVAENLTAS